jgi:RND family efflux transporter MFP subunit
MTTKQIIAAVTTAVIAMLVLMFSACSSEKQSQAPAPEVVRGVALITTQRAMQPDYLEAPGTVRAAQSAQLASQMMGTITAVNVHEGQAVRRGQVLITIDGAQPHAAYEGATAGLRASKQVVAAADADYALADATMKRYQSLYDKQSVSPQEYDEVKTRLEAAKARRNAAQAGTAQAQAAVTESSTTVGFTRIRAPFDGLITAKLLDPGAMASPGVPLLVMEDPSRFRLEASVDESQIGVVKLGATVPVVIDSLGGQEIVGKVVQILPAADPASRTFTVKVVLPSNPLIRSGVFGRARFSRGQREALSVPPTALLQRGQLDAVYVVSKDGLATLRYVTLGKPSSGNVEVLSGLADGDRVVAETGGRELAGKRVEGQ